MSDLVTGEAVPLEVRLAKFPSRALAIMIDFAILLVAGIVLISVAAAAVGDANPAAGAAIIIATLVLLLIGVPTTIETLTRGRSAGKLAMGLRVVRDDGGPVRFRHAVLRALAGVFVDFYLTSGAGAVICSLLNERGKRVGDYLAGTVVVRERAPSVHAPLPAAPPELASWAATLELSQLPDNLAMAARNYLARGRQLSPRVRDEMGAQLATEMSRLVSPAPPAGVPAWAYLAAVLAERGRRESARIAAERTSYPAGSAAASSAPAPSPAPGLMARLDARTTHLVDGAAPSDADAPQPPGGGGFAPPA